jgi:DegV family protein with EDD domain
VKRVAIVADSTADLSQELRKRYRITMVPLNVHFGSETFRDQLDLSSQDFMSRLAASSIVPTTSQPSPGLFEETFRRLAVDHDEIVAVLLSSKLSGTLQSAQLAAEAVRDTIPVEIVDSLSGSLGAGLQAIRASELVDQGIGGSEIARQLRVETQAYHLLFLVDTLEYLQRNGRIGRAAGLVGTLIRLKPLLRVDEGQVVPYERTRTRARAIEGLVDFVTDLPRVERLAVMYATSKDDAHALADRLASLKGLGSDQVFIGALGPVIGSHIGPGGMGVAVFDHDSAPANHPVAG